MSKNKIYSGINHFLSKALKILKMKLIKKINKTKIAIKKDQTYLIKICTGK